MKQSSYLLYIGIAKCLAIWLMLWGHAMTQLMPSHDLNSNPAFVWLYSFHMPLFMLMSGLFAKKALERPLGEMLWIKFKQLIVPTFVFGAVWLVVDKPGELLTYVLDPAHRDYLGLTLAVGKHFSTCYWFLKSLFLCFVIGWFVMHSMPKWLAAVAFLVAFLVLQRWDITCFKMGSMLPFFLLGIWVKPHLQWIKNRAPELFFLSALLHSFLILSGIYNQSLAFPTYFFSNPNLILATHGFVIYLLTATCGCLLLLCICVLLEEHFAGTKLVDWMNKAGMMTLKIYLWQKILLEILLPKVLTVNMPLWSFDLLFTPTVAIVALLICCFAPYVKRHSY